MVMDRHLVDKAEVFLKYKLAKRGKSIIGGTLYYMTLLSLSFVFLYPLMYMLSKSMMQTWDVADATVRWLPKQLSFENYRVALDAINYWQGLTNSTIISLGSAILQIISCAFVGYGLARYRFPGYGLLLALVVFTFLVPPQTIVVPLYLFFSDLGWIDTHWPFIVPSMLAHGLKGSLFVLIFIQFFRGLPSVLEEAARIDGAGPFMTYWRIMFPLAKPSMLVVFLFSVVWHWNDMFEPNTYLMVPTFYNLTQRMALFFGNANMSAQQMSQMVSSDAIGMAPTMLNQMMAALVLTVLPVLILYLFIQKYFVESVERSGIAGE